MTTKYLVYTQMAIAMLCAGCSTIKDGDYYPAEKGDYMVSDRGGEGLIGGGTDGESGGEGSRPQTQAGVLTAGEWNDLDNWSFWGGLLSRQDDSDSSFYKYCPYWKFYTQNRIAVKVETSSGLPVAGAKVELLLDGQKEWVAVTDVFGRADCWASLFEARTIADSALTVKVDGIAQTGVPSITRWSCDTVAMNVYTVGSAPAVAGADIAFIVDATGSMGDEITFLKDDLLDIFAKVDSCVSIPLRTAALFYRDEGDDYVTKASDFNTVAATAAFVKNQNANGGGDYPEAVHTALQKTLQDLTWNQDAKARIAFMLLDAPAHHESKIIESLQSGIKAFSKAGIRLIPVAASGVDKNTEFMLRFFAVSTGGTYVFLTDDSGVGGSHIIPTVGKYEVENLNALIVRLILEYADGKLS